MTQYLSTGGLTPDDTRLLGAAVGDTVQHSGVQFRFVAAARDGLECVEYPRLPGEDVLDGQYAELWQAPDAALPYEVAVSVSVLDGVVRTFIGPAPAPIHAAAASFALVRAEALVKAAADTAQLKEAIRGALRGSHRGRA